MWRMIAVAILTMAGAGGLLARAQAPPGNAALAPNPWYHPSDGDQAEIVLGGVPGAVSRATLDEFVKARDSGDRAGMDRLTKTGAVFTLGRRTAVKVINVYSVPRIRAADPRYGFTMKEYEVAMRAAIAREGDHPAGYPIEVQVLDGQHIGKILTVEKQHVGRLAWQKAADPNGPMNDLSIFNNPSKKKAKAAARPIPRPLPPRPVDPAAQAAGTLQLGKNLRFEGNRDAAIEYFRKAIMQAPDSWAAAEARATLKVMGVK